MMDLRHGLLIPNAGHYAHAERLVETAIAAESAGWHGVFLWDHLLLPRELELPLIDTWTVVSAILARTRALVSGPLVTPLARRRPWKVARETATLDRLSGGRLVLGVGLGADGDLDFAAFGESGGLGERAARTDEALDVITGLWGGTEFSHTGRHYTVDRARFLPTPTVGRGGRMPRVPVWVAVTWPATNTGALQRATRHDAVVPMVRDPRGGLREPTVPELRQIVAGLGEASAGSGQRRRETRQSDVVALAAVPPGDRGAAVEQAVALAELGATWRLESFDPWRRPPRDLDRWLRGGPPIAARPATSPTTSPGGPHA